MHRREAAHRRGRAALLALAFALGLGGTWLFLARPGSVAAAQMHGLAREEAPIPGPEPAEAVAEPFAPEAAPPLERATPEQALSAWVGELRAELVRQPFQARAYRERVAACLEEWVPELGPVLLRALESPPREDAEFVALASLARAQAIALAPALASRLRPLALREDLPLGVSLESARCLVAAGGVAELGWWCNALETADSPRARSIAAGALEAVRDGASERYLVERALELVDPRASARLLDALARSLSQVQEPWENPARQACANRLAEVALDSMSDARLRARSLGVLRSLDPDAAARIGAEWFLEPGAGDERLEFAASSLHGRAGAIQTLRLASEDPRLDSSRRARLAECVLFAEPAALAPQVRDEALGCMRGLLQSPSEPAARRRALHALARFGSDADRALVQQVADADTDLLARAAARNSLMRETSEWR
ncbi:MAG: hypothetical protein IPJ19_03205 [Planctomycetes bacterium]|nr:hypothetical protein [Planctomycetota bacterium]